MTSVRIPPSGSDEIFGIPRSSCSPTSCFVRSFSCLFSARG